MTNPVQPVIVVKKKSGHAAHHGGAWKVAYADFVTAMMAFFLVMWLVNQSKPVKAAIGGYFRDPAAFDASGGRGVLPGGDTVNPPKPATPTAEQEERKRMEAAVMHIREGLDNDAFKSLRDQVEFTITPEGLRIDLMDKDDSMFFDSGSASLHGETEHILGVIAHELGSLDHQVDLEGHTDSRGYTATDKYSNWELSADRANAARRVMERGGLRGAQVTSVRGLADRQLRFPADPFDARNRRVSILVKNPLLKTPAAGSADPARPEASTPSVADKR
jgi:chemotaxis protein MotB